MRWFFCLYRLAVNMAGKREKITVQKVAEESVPQNERQEDQLLDPDGIISY